MYEDINGRCQHKTETGCLCMEPWPCPQHTSHDRWMNPFGISIVNKKEKKNGRKQTKTTS
jgi:hypothetical protein